MLYAFNPRDEEAPRAVRRNECYTDDDCCANICLSSLNLLRADGAQLYAPCADDEVTDASLPAWRPQPGDRQARKKGRGGMVAVTVVRRNAERL